MANIWMHFANYLAGKFFSSSVCRCTTSKCMNNYELIRTDANCVQIQTVRCNSLSFYLPFENAQQNKTASNEDRHRRTDRYQYKHVQNRHTNIVYALLLAGFLLVIFFFFFFFSVRWCSHELTLKEFYIHRKVQRMRATKKKREPNCTTMQYESNTK